MKKIISAILIAILSFGLLAGPACGQENMNRIRAIEALFYLLVEAKFTDAHRLKALSGNLSGGKDLRTPLDFDIISVTVNSILKNEILGEGRLWIHRSFWRKVRDKWDGLGGKIDRDRIVVYEDVKEFVRGFNQEEDIALMYSKDVDRLALELFGNGSILNEAVILSPLDIHLEYLDQYIIALVLIDELKEMIKEHPPEEVIASNRFRTLRSVLESLLAWRAGFDNEDILNMIPRPDLPFEVRVFILMQHSMMPIRKEDIERIRKIQSAVDNI